MSAHGEAAQQRGGRHAQKAGHRFQFGLVRLARAAVRLVELQVAQEEHRGEHAHHVQERNAQDTYTLNNTIQVADDDSSEFNDIVHIENDALPRHAFQLAKRRASSA